MKKEIINRKQALQKIQKHSKYVALTALGTYLILQPKEAQAASLEAPGTGF